MTKWRTGQILQAVQERYAMILLPFQAQMRDKNSMSDKERLNLQDQFLNTLRKEHITVSVFLVNGIKLVGRIESFDQYMVLLRGHDQAVQAIFKHAISTVSPSKQISLAPGQQAARPASKEAE